VELGSLGSCSAPPDSLAVIRERGGKGKKRVENRDGGEGKGREGRERVGGMEAYEGKGGWEAGGRGMGEGERESGREDRERGRTGLGYLGPRVPSDVTACNVERSVCVCVCVSVLNSDDSVQF